MKINTSEICKRFLSKVDEDNSSLKKEHSQLTDSKAYLRNNIVGHKDFINNFCVLDYNNLDDLDFCFFERRLLQKKYEYAEYLLTTEEKVKRLLNMFIEVKRRISKIELKLKEVEGLKIDPKDFTKIIGDFNSKIVDEILKGYSYNLGYSLSYLRIKGRDVTLRKKKKIDWGKSNKYKKEIIEAGGIPYEVLERNEKGEIIKDNGGTYWLAYHNKTIEYLWHWAKGRTALPNKYFYKFKPTYCGAANNGCVQKLRQLEATNSDYLKYFN